VASEVLLPLAHLLELDPLFHPHLPLPLLLLPLELLLLHLELPVFPCRALEVLLPTQEATSSLVSPLKDLQEGLQLNHTKEVHLPKGILGDLQPKEGLHNMAATHRLPLSSHMVAIMEDPQDLEDILDIRDSQEDLLQLRGLHNKDILQDQEDHLKAQHQTLEPQGDLLVHLASPPGNRSAMI